MEGNRIGLELRSLNNLIRRFFEFSTNKREVESITGNNGWIIGYLADNAQRDIYQRDIEEHFTITRSTVSKVLSLMEQKGLIKRQVVSQDARLKKIVLTERAWEIHAVMMEDIIKLEDTLTDGFSQEEIGILQSYLKRMRCNISSAQEKNGGNLND